MYARSGRKKQDFANQANRGIARLAQAWENRGVTSRFAPSPTGLLHLGHAYSAWLAWKSCQKAGGRFLLRFEDIDHTRVREEYYRGIEEDLTWLGLGWEGVPVRQLERLPLYEEALARLQNAGLLYRCFCTRRDLAIAAPQQGDGATIYPGTCRNLSEREEADLLESGKSFAWRMDMAKAARQVGELSFHDQARGEVSVKPSLLGDPVLARKDIATSYHLAVVVDDAAQEVTHVARGKDLLDSTHVHRVLQELLDYPAPQYFHHRLVLDGEGKRLAKRNDSLAIATLREVGYRPREVREMAGCLRPPWP